MSTEDADGADLTRPRVRTEQVGRVRVLTMDRPARANAIDARMTAAIDAALNTAEDDRETGAVVITGGARLFSAGTDLETGSGSPTARGGEYGVIRRRAEVPLIAAVEGAAFGGGFEIAMACDLVVAATTARFALPETHRGVVASSGALFRAAAVLPHNVAFDLLLTGRELSGEEAHRLGFVNRLATPGGSIEDAIALAQLVLEGAPTARRETLRAMRAAASRHEDEGWALTEQALRASLATDERSEGLAAFKEGRRPTWTPGDDT